MTNDKHIADAVNLVDSIVGQDGLNLLINNAAMLQREGSEFPSIDRANLMRHFDANVASPILIAQVRDFPLYTIMNYLVIFLKCNFFRRLFYHCYAGLPRFRKTIECRFIVRRLLIFPAALVRSVYRVPIISSWDWDIELARYVFLCLTLFLLVHNAVQCVPQLSAMQCVLLEYS